MSVVFHALALADTATALSGMTGAGFIPNPEPVDPTDGSAAVSLLFSMLKGGIILAAALGALISIYYLIFGRFADSPKALSNGKLGIPIAAFCVVLAFVTIPAFNALEAAL